MSQLPKYRYADLHPNHEIWKIAKYFGEQGQESISDTEIHDAVEYILDGLAPEPIEDLGNLEIYGFALNPDIEDYSDEYEGDPLIETCIVIVNPLEWAKKNRPDWLE
jgi:hypothetical protein